MGKEARQGRARRGAEHLPESQRPRQAALALLSAVLGEGRPLSDVEERLLEGLPPEARARAGRLADAVLRNLPRADRLLAPHLTKRPPMATLNLLRLGTTELAEGAAAHGVVSDIVGLAGHGKKTAQHKGLVNAVLRKVAEEAPEAWEGLPVPRLPGWLRKPLNAAYGPARTAAMERAHHAGAPLDLTAKGDPQALAEATGGELLPTGSVRIAGSVQVSALPGFAEGAFWVQDAAAALPAKLLGAKAGAKVLDLCAAPGGKTLQMAATGAEVTALDISGPRLARLRENLARTGLATRTVTADALHWEGGPFDAILLDAPCSATGTVRRHPDLPFARTAASLAPLAELQAALIDRAVALLAPGGTLVYCTCSLLPEEGAAQVEAALGRHASLALERPDAEWIEEAWRSPEGGLRLTPDLWAERGGMDGFYIARMVRAG
ncbi:RsmB/NOP family class I SAM-dependent RNA methyltransferase [Pseudoroseicyclus tamaricis]|uniref:Methyltransferase domain-containing protein n=1 Tax=Pseudoroseicyclus tamaricis TaxID=2705421 RepID=A0A6B2JWT6_9RHOB|nr:transcription antitermination factor NusB [Pseudoroseicyclus tamaricis]NDV02678.1 methyltransferase domain-containing protein [Pseudoroseicyclus tamaricis]